MKNVFFILLIACSTINVSAQKAIKSVSPDSVSIESRVEFFTYNGPWGDKENVKAPAVRFVLTIRNNGKTPIPDLGATNRSEYLNLIINGKIQNPVSMYNGTELSGDHLIKPKGTDTYTWWFFTNEEAYGNVFNVQWQYVNLLSTTYEVNMTRRTVEAILVD